jgi:hypothetical protein
MSVVLQSLSVVLLSVLLLVSLWPAVTSPSLTVLGLEVQSACCWVVLGQHKLLQQLLLLRLQLLDSCFGRSTSRSCSCVTVCCHHLLLLLRNCLGRSTNSASRSCRPVTSCYSQLLQPFNKLLADLHSPPPHPTTAAAAAIPTPELC